MGYYVNNAYAEEFTDLIENPPSVVDTSKLTRHILVEKPRVTKFQIQWEDENSFNQQNVGIAPQMMIGGQPQPDKEIMPDGTQVQMRNDMMSNTNLMEAAQNFNQGGNGQQ